MFLKYIYVKEVIMSIDARVMLRDEGVIEIPKSNLTTEYNKDIKILTYYITEDLKKFDSSNFEIIEYSEDRILVVSDKRHWLLMIDNVYVVTDILTVEYRTYLVRE